MGEIEQIITQRKVPQPPFNDRFTVELCENVHLHYRNLRLEFSPEEFFDFIVAIRKIRGGDLLNFEYGHNKFKELLHCKLIPTAEWNDRLQIERQRNGMFHMHYRNMRIEVNSLSELGFDNEHNG